MDAMVISFAAILFAVIAAVIALIKRKKIGKIFIFAGSGLIIGLLIGYVLAPTVVSFF
jgi:Na+-translocating ferredoxin:NAD+ oxidoreductase RnfD subunit